MTEEEIAEAKRLEELLFKHVKHCIMFDAEYLEATIKMVDKRIMREGVDMEYEYNDLIEIHKKLSDKLKFLQRYDVND